MHSAGLKPNSFQLCESECTRICVSLRRLKSACLLPTWRGDKWITVKRLLLDLMSHFTSITDGKYQHPATALEALPDYRESNRSSPLRHFPFNHTRKVSSLHVTAVQGYIALIKKQSQCTGQENEHTTLTSPVRLSLSCWSLQWPKACVESKHSDLWERDCENRRMQGSSFAFPFNFFFFF